MDTLLTYRPLTPENWDDFEVLFGEKGAYGGCWCTHWRIPRKQRDKYDGNRDIMKHVVWSGVVPGIIGYMDANPVAWCSVGPRTDYAALESSRLLKRVDDEPVWSIACFFVKHGQRNKGVMLQSVQAAVQYASSQNAAIVEAYPIEINEHMNAPGGYMGLRSVFVKAGFSEVSRVSDTQYIMRRHTDV